MINLVTNLSVKIELAKDQPRGILQQVIQRTIDLSAVELKGNLQRNSPVDQSKMQSSWFISPVTPRLQSKVFSSAMYTPFVNYGTGIYGPRGRKIYPKTKRFLSFEYKGKKIAVPWVRGQKPQKFVEKSIVQTEGRSDELVIRAMIEKGGGL